jgi:anaerobic selenocysteine-containing dehydrogenase
LEGGFQGGVAHGPLNRFAGKNIPLVNLPGEIIATQQVQIMIAKKLGIGDKFGWGKLANYGTSTKDWHNAYNDYVKRGYEAWRTIPSVKTLMGRDPPTWDELQKSPVIRWPETKPYYAFGSVTDPAFGGKEGGNPFSKTPSKKIEFYSGLAEMINKTGLPTTLPEVARRSLVACEGYYDPLSRWQPAHDLEAPKQSWYNKIASTYPIMVTSPVSTFRSHSYGDCFQLLNDCYRHSVWMSPADAKARGIVDNDLVRVYSVSGEAVLPAYVTSRESPGCACIHHGAWYTPTDFKTQLDPYGLDVRGAPNILLVQDHGNDNPNAIIDRGLVQIEKFGYVTRTSMP